MGHYDGSLCVASKPFIILKNILKSLYKEN